MRGLSLIELMIALGIMSLLLMLSLPLTQRFISRHRQEARVHDLIHAVQFARTEAIEQGVHVIFCGSDDGKHCNGRWSSGQLACRDPDDTRQCLSSSQLLYAWPALPRHEHLSWHGFSSDQYLMFEPNGLNQASNGYFLYSPSTPNGQAKKIILNRLGRLRTESVGAYS